MPTCLSLQLAAVTAKRQNITQFESYAVVEESQNIQPLNMKTVHSFKLLGISNPTTQHNNQYGLNPCARVQQQSIE